MTKETILDNEKLIADFMQESAIGGYYNSYDWLMPVVENINSLGDYEFSIIGLETEVCSMGHLMSTIVITREYPGLTLIDSIYQTVVKFINWYNNKQTQRKLLTDLMEMDKEDKLDG